MNNYYEVLGLDSNLSVEEINEILEDKHSRALRILNTAVGDAEREYKVRKDLELIEEALKVFKNEESRAKYDARLKAFNKSNKKSGLLVTEKPDTEVDENEDDSELKPEEELEERSRENSDLEEYKKYRK